MTDRTAPASWSPVRSLDVWYDDGSTQTVTGTMNQSTTWTAADGPYRVDDTLTVAPGATLTIEPGTTVFFTTGARLSVRGRLVAVGQPAANDSLHSRAGQQQLGRDPVRRLHAGQSDRLRHSRVRRDERRNDRPARLSADAAAFHAGPHRSTPNSLDRFLAGRSALHLHKHF